MSKPLLLFQAPIATRSGYGDHSRDILKSLFDLDKYEVKIVPTRWGNTPQDQIDPQTEFGQKILSNIVTQLDKQPDIFIQISVANEFKKVGKYNIGITAGVETTLAVACTRWGSTDFGFGEHYVCAENRHNDTSPTILPQQNLRTSRQT